MDDGAGFTAGVDDPFPVANRPSMEGTSGQSLRFRRWAPWIALAVGAIAGMLSLLPAHDIAGLTPITGHTWSTVGARLSVRSALLRDLAIWWGLFALTAVGLLHAPRRASVTVALLLGVGLGLASLAHTAVLSNDLYRYAWDGKVQAAGIDPYRYPPNDPHLARLHDSWLWPSDTRCADLGKSPGCTVMNRPGVRTIYPPLAQLWFRLGYAVLPAGSRDTGWEVLGLIVATLTAGLLVGTLVRTRRDPRLVVLWSGCPVVALEAVQNAHVDSVAALAVLGAAALARRAPGRAGLLTGIAGLVKLYPLVLLPAVVQRRRGWGWALAIGVVVVAYLPYIVGVGGHVAGYLHGYLDEEGYSSGTRFGLLALLGLPPSAAKAFAGLLILVVFLLAVARRLGPPERAALAVFVAVVFIATPGEPWYELGLVVLVALTGAWQWLGVVVAEYVGYLLALLGHPRFPVADTLYAAALFAGIMLTLVRRRLARPVPVSA